MYISKIKISNFRNYQDSEIVFNDGSNVIIGHNNAGKSNLIKALSIVLDSQAVKQLDVDDFNKYISLEELKENPPQISIAIYIEQSEKEDLNSDDLVTVGNWITQLNEPYQALLTYQFFLPEKERIKYLQEIEPATDSKTAWKIIKQDFIRLYVYKIWGGDPIAQTVADGESLRKFDFQFLDAIRDVERDMLTGKNTLLKNVLDFFMDYEIKSDTSKDEEVKRQEIEAKRKDFSSQADQLITSLQKRMEEGKGKILSYAKDTGASFNKANPNFEGGVSDIEMFSAFKLIVEYETGIKIPATHNGLGYNNLIFMSLLLAKMQVNSDGKYLGSNAKVFPILAIEEPEAHLHPAMQYQFLKFLKKNELEKKVRQIFVTTHSTHITSSVLLDELICLHNENGKTLVGYPGKVFQNDERSKKYVQRFLDATRSDMLFAQKVILVEGLSEVLLLPILAQYEGVSLEENHVTVINVGGRYFDHFLKLFDQTKQYTIYKKVACLTDIDPSRSEKGKEETYRKCYPYEMNIDELSCDYKLNASLDKYSEGKYVNISSYTQDKKYGKTFEYDLVLSNPTLDLLVTDSMSNRKEIIKLMKLYETNKPISDYIALLSESKENRRIIKAIESANQFEPSQKAKAIIASRYLNSIGKGENALELAYALSENYALKGTSKYKEVVVPAYIRKAFEWICK